MAQRKGGSRSRNRRGDPGQLSLFDAREQRGTPSGKTATTKRILYRRTLASKTDQPVILSPREAAAYLNVAVSTLKSWRAKKIGPNWSRRGSRLVCYFPEDLDDFLRRGAQSRDKL